MPHCSLERPRAGARWEVLPVSLAADASEALELSAAGEQQTPDAAAAVDAGAALLQMQARLGDRTTHTAPCCTCAI